MPYLLHEQGSWMGGYGLLPPGTFLRQKVGTHDQFYPVPACQAILANTLYLVLWTVFSEVLQTPSLLPKQD